MRKIDHSRRQFMKTASYAAMAGVSASPTLHSMRALAAMTSHAASAPTDYRALVCVYLQGGNDGHGTLIATDPDSFTAFTAARSGAVGLAYPLNELLPITPVTPQSGRTFALNPYLTGVQNLFNFRPGCLGSQHRNAGRSGYQGSMEPGHRHAAPVTVFAF